MKELIKIVGKSLWNHPFWSMLVACCAAFCARELVEILEVFIRGGKRIFFRVLDNGGEIRFYERKNGVFFQLSKDDFDKAVSVVGGNGESDDDKKTS